ncbi:hypothetical protein E2C01_077017 [Portunus trituberculatus]|uniref:Uncharacterized protein n=1 Tax=Portunus trituberculatus TaxID=210409 RepID=A0A5B7IL54_PORTR|nr:hypothetical protein [Portunus trituberculatus]
MTNTPGPVASRTHHQRPHHCSRTHYEHVSMSYHFQEPSPQVPSLPSPHYSSRTHYFQDHRFQDGIAFHFQLPVQRWYHLHSSLTLPTPEEARAAPQSIATSEHRVWAARGVTGARLSRPTTSGEEKTGCCDALLKINDYPPRDKHASSPQPPAPQPKPDQTNPP